jgi:hypothetical protein
MSGVRFRCWARGAGSVLLELAAVAALAAQPVALRLEPCRVADVEERCAAGRLTVPEDRTVRRGRTVSLRIVPASRNGWRVAPAALHPPGRARPGRDDACLLLCRDLRAKRGATGISSSSTSAAPAARTRSPAAAKGRRTTRRAISAPFPAGNDRRCRAALEGRADLRATPLRTRRPISTRSALRSATIGSASTETSYGTRAALFYAQTRRPASNR